MRLAEGANNLLGSPSVNVTSLASKPPFSGSFGECTRVLVGEPAPECGSTSLASTSPVFVSC